MATLENILSVFRHLTSTTGISELIEADQDSSKCTFLFPSLGVRTAFKKKECEKPPLGIDSMVMMMIASR